MSASTIIVAINAQTLRSLRLDHDQGGEPQARIQPA